MFLRFFVILLVFSSVYVHLLLFSLFDSMFQGLFDCFDTVLGCCLD